MTSPTIRLIPQFIDRPSVGNIYQLRENLLVLRDGGGRNDRLTLIKENEFIECRQAISVDTWVMRGVDNFHFYATAEDMQRTKMDLIGMVFVPVRVHSNATLDDIMRLRLYLKPNEF